MLNISRNNNQVYLLYGARNYATGISVSAEVYDNSNNQISGSPITLNEIGTTGLYGAYFTPTTNGDYKIIVFEAAVKMATSGIKVADNDIESNGTNIVSIKSLVENSTYGLQALYNQNTAMQGSGFITTSDSLQAIKSYLVNTIQTSIAQIQNNTLVSVSLPSQMIIPDSSATNFKFFVNVYDEEGLPADPYDQDPGAGIAMMSVDVTNESGTSRNSNLSGLNSSTIGGLNWMTRVSTGRFSAYYSVAYNHAKEQLNFNWTFKRQAGDPDIPVDRSSMVTMELDVSANVDYIKAQIDNATYGLSAIKVLIDTYQTANQLDFTNIENKIDIIDTNVDSINASLSSATYGLSALKTLIDNITSSLNDIMGTGFNTATDSLKAIREGVDAVFNKVGGYII